MKKIGVLAICLMFFVLSMGFASALLTISEPEEIYNFGDKIYVNVEGIRGSESGNLNIDLECGGNVVNLMKISARRFSPEGGQSDSFDKILTKEDLEVESLISLIGTCQVSVNIGTEHAVTKDFEITNEIIIDANVDKDGYNPGESITLTVGASKANGDLVEGIVEASGASEFSEDISAGVATESFSMPGDSAAGDYILNIFVHDVTEDMEIFNEGQVEVVFKINQIASDVKTSLSALEITPEEQLTVSADVYDQSGDAMGGEVSVLLISPNGDETIKTVESGEFISFDFRLNASVGKWKIRSSFGDVTKETEFEMLGLQKVEFEFQGSILIVKNIGNTRYNKTIDVDIGDTTESITLNMGVGAKKMFNLNAPEGEYDVGADDGETKEVSTVALTGKAVSIKDLENVGIFKGYSIVWVFLIVIVLGVGVVVFFKRKKKPIKFGVGNKIKKVKEVPNKIRGKIEEKMPKKYASKVANTLQLTNKSPKAQNLDGEEENHGMIDMTSAKVGKAESSLVLKGDKSPSAVVSLYIKNYDSLGKDGRQRLAKIVAGVKNKKGLVDWKGEHIFIVFSPLATKTFKNDILAARTGFEIFEKITSQNKKFKDKIEFNIGVNSGDLVASKEKGRLKYTSIGNTIALAKRIADSSSGKLLVSDAVHKKLMRVLKGENVGEIAKSKVWEVSRMVDTEANADKLKELLKRMEKS